MGNAWSVPEVFNPNALWTPGQLLPYFFTGLYIVFIVWKSCWTFLIFTVSLPILLFNFLFILILLFLFRETRRTAFLNASTECLGSLSPITTKGRLSSASLVLSPALSPQVSFVFNLMFYWFTNISGY